MVTRADILGARPLLQIEPTVPVRTSSDARQETFNRLTQIALGKQLQAEVTAELGKSHYLVKLEGVDARVNLPQGTQVGDKLPMTMLAHEPRPTLLLGAKPEPEVATLSNAARVIAGILQAASEQKGQTALTAARPLMAAAPANPAAANVAPQLARAMQSAISDSGLFYESHLQQWVDGQRPTTALLREPQAQSPRAMAPLAIALPALARLLSQATPTSGQPRNLQSLLQSPGFQAAAAPVLQEIQAAQPVLERLLSQVQALATPAAETPPDAKPAPAGAAATPLPAEAVPGQTPAEGELPVAAEALPGAEPMQPAETVAAEAPLPDAELPQAPLPGKDAPATQAPTFRFARAMELPDPATLPALLAKLPPAAMSPAMTTLANNVANHPALASLLLFLGSPAQAALPYKELVSQPKTLALFQQAAQEIAKSPESLRQLLPAPAAAAAMSARSEEAATVQHRSLQTEADLDILTDADMLVPAHVQPAMTEDLTQVISQQLNALENKQILWRGEIWPGQFMDWQIEEGQQQASQGQAGSQETPWNSKLRLNLPTIGEVDAIVSLRGDRVAMKLDVKDETTAQMLRANARELVDALALSGSFLEALLINRDA